MASSLATSACDPLQYCSPGELSQLEERFDFALQDITCLVFWTGVRPELARCWAEQHGLPTLTLAMGSLYSDRDTGSVRRGKSTKGWSKYMKGASARFAEYACRGGRRAIILTNPPPDIYSTRKWSNYRYLEEPILKGAVGRPGTARIEYAHPTVVGGATFQYQIWPLDESSKWYTYLTKIPAKVHISREYIFAENQVTVEAVQVSGVVVQLHDNTHAFEKEPKIYEPKGVAETGHNSIRKRVELEMRIAPEKKEAKRKRVELERRIAQEKTATKRKRVELERRIAQEKTATKRKRVELEQQLEESGEATASRAGAREGSREKTSRVEDAVRV